jgi:hypothetical protein
MPKPFRIIHSDDVVLPMHDQFLGKELYDEFWVPLLTFSAASVADECKQDEHNNFDVQELKHSPAMQDAIAFTRKYLIKDIARQLESRLKTDDLYEGAEHYVMTLFTGNYPDDAKQLVRDLEANYAQKAESGVEERYKLIESFVEQQIDKTLQRYAKGGDNRHCAMLTDHETEDKAQGLMFHISAVLSDGYSREPAEKGLASTLAQMPEWLQLMTHDTGFLAFTKKLKAGTIGVSINDDNLDMPVIGLSPNAIMDGRRDTPKERLNRIHLLREELLHSYQDYVDRQNDKNEMHDASGRTLGERWHDAATALIKQLDADPNHPANHLISQSEPGGGSLMRLKNSHVRAGELLVDVMDAEDYLRREMRSNGGDPQEAKKVEQELRQAFGNDVYDLSRQYITTWIEHAAQVAEPVLGKEETARLKQKWLDDPFNHNIVINKRPEFAITVGGTSPSLPK